MENYIEYGYVGLAVISFLAATILPVGSEVFFMAMIAAGYPAGWCLWWASLGNTLGGMTNYYLGRLGKTEWLEKHLKFSAAKMAGVQEQLRYKGALSAFFSFLPAVGDVIPFVLGYMRASGSVTARQCLPENWPVMLYWSGERGWEWTFFKAEFYLTVYF